MSLDAGVVHQNGNRSQTLQHVPADVSDPGGIGHIARVKVEIVTVFLKEKLLRALLVQVQKHHLISPVQQGAADGLANALPAAGDQRQIMLFHSLCPSCHRFPTLWTTWRSRSGLVPRARPISAATAV